MKDDFSDIIDALDSKDEKEGIDLLEEKREAEPVQDSQRTVQPDVTADNFSKDEEDFETGFYGSPIDPQNDESLNKTEQPIHQTEDNPEDLTPADRVFSHYDMNDFSQQEAPNAAPQYQSVYRREPYIDGRPLQSKLVSGDAPSAGYTLSQRSQEDRRYDRRQGSRARSGAKLGAGTIAVLLIVCILVSGLAGFGGSMLAGYLRGAEEESDAMVIQKMEGDGSSGGEKAADKSTAQIASEVEDSVVEITTEVMQTGSIFGQYISTGAGSGVIISGDGYIVTNNHVIEGASSINVTLHSGKSYQATVKGSDDVVDIALLKIESEEKLTSAVFGDSSKVNVGDKAVVIGNPLGTLGGSVTEGIISALDRSIVIDGKSMHLMQTDAAINPGNSGGGTFDGQGTLIGIVVAKSSNSSSGTMIDNIGFVIPINNVLAILNDLKQYGYVRGRGDTGMTFVDLNNSMYSMYYYGNPNPGVYISSVSSNSNASDAGFRQGDRVISVNEKNISSSSEIDTIISGLSAGETVSFEVERGSETLTLSLTLDERKPDDTTPEDTNSYYPQSPFGFGGF